MEQPVISISELTYRWRSFYFKTYACMSPENAPQFEKQLEYIHPALELVEDYPLHSAGYGGGIMSIMLRLADKQSISKDQLELFKNDPNTWFTKTLVKLDTSNVYIKE